jgi:hypothetical protein
VFEDRPRPPGGLRPWRDAIKFSLINRDRAEAGLAPLPPIDARFDEAFAGCARVPPRALYPRIRGYSAEYEAQFPAPFTPPMMTPPSHGGIARTVRGDLDGHRGLLAARRYNQDARPLPATADGLPALRIAGALIFAVLLEVHLGPEQVYTTEPEHTDLGESVESRHTGDGR